MTEQSLVEQSFRKAMVRAGLEISEPVLADGELHRFKVSGDKSGIKSGEYQLFRGPLAGGFFRCYRSGIYRTWCIHPPQNLTPRQHIFMRHRLKKARQRRCIASQPVSGRLEQSTPPSFFQSQAYGEVIDAN